MKRTYLTVFSPLLQSFALEQCFHLFYIIFSWKFFEFRNWNALKNAKTASRTGSKLRVSTTAFLRPLAEMANVCLSLGGGHVVVTSSVRSAR